MIFLNYVFYIVYLYFILNKYLLLFYFILIFNKKPNLQSLNNFKFHHILFIEKKKEKNISTCIQIIKYIVNYLLKKKKYYS